MNIEIKNIKFIASMTRETHCFSASLYQDGVKIGTVKNDGHGGCNQYSDYKSVDKIVNDNVKLTH